jgi:hypothetical protein
MTDELPAVDRKALQRAINLTLAESDQGRAEQVRNKLGEQQDWFEVATFCAYHQQSKALQLRPWEYAPAWIDPAKIADILAAGQSHDDIHGKFDAAKLAQRLISSGRSIFEPNPLGV